MSTTATKKPDDPKSNAEREAFVKDAKEAKETREAKEAKAADPAKCPAHPMNVGDVCHGKILADVLKGAAGQFEVTKAGRTDRVTVDHDGKIEFTPDIPEDYKKDTDEEWTVKKIA